MHLKKISDEKKSLVYYCNSNPESGVEKLKADESLMTLTLNDKKTKAEGLKLKAERPKQKAERLKLKDQSAKQKD